MSVRWTDRRVADRRRDDIPRVNAGQSGRRDSDEIAWSEHKRAAIAAVRAKTLTVTFDTDQ